MTNPINHLTQLFFFHRPLSQHMHWHNPNKYASIFFVRVPYRPMSTLISVNHRKTLHENAKIVALRVLARHGKWGEIFFSSCGGVVGFGRRVGVVSRREHTMPSSLSTLVFLLNLSVSEFSVVSLTSCIFILLEPEITQSFCAWSVERACTQSGSVSVHELSDWNVCDILHERAKPHGACLRQVAAFLLNQSSSLFPPFASADAISFHTTGCANTNLVTNFQDNSDWTVCQVASWSASRKCTKV